MASVAYDQWVAAGKPLDPCQPVEDFVNKLKVAFPKGDAAHLFSWHSNDAHYKAEPPEDHTPYSATGWPKPSPRWVVFATDVMHRPDLGVDCHKLFAYWLAEAKAGRMPWLKYMNWEGKRYDVRNNWKPVPTTGHFDHIHLSGRTDHQNTSLGSWPITGDDMADVDLRRGRPAPAAYADPTRGPGVELDDLHGQEMNGKSPYGNDKSYRTKQLDQLVKDVAELKARPPVQSAPVDPAALKAVLMDPEVLAAYRAAVLHD